MQEPAQKLPVTDQFPWRTVLVGFAGEERLHYCIESRRSARMRCAGVLLSARGMMPRHHARGDLRRRTQHGMDGACAIWPPVTTSTVRSMSRC